MISASDQAVSESGTFAVPIEIVDFDGDGIAIDSVSATGGLIDATLVEGATRHCATGVLYDLTFDTGETFEGLALGEDAVVVVTVVADDGSGGLIAREVKITVTGENDTPTLNPVAIAAEETGGPVSVDLADYADDIDSDDDGTTLTYAITLAPAEGVASVSGTGVTATDRHGASAVNTVTVTVTGTNDAPSAGALSGPWTKAPTRRCRAAATRSPSLRPSRMWARSTAIRSAWTPPGTLGLVTDNLDGMFTYSANGAFEHLAIGRQATDTFTYAVDDGSGGVDTEVVTITVEGANDAPRTLTTPDTDAETLAETGVPLTVSSSLTFSDVDISDSVTAAVTGFTASGAMAVLARIPSGDLLGMLTLDTPNVLSGVENLERRRSTFNSGTTNFAGLSLGESHVLTYTVTATDVRGAEATHAINITIEGRNNVPTISIDPALPFLEQSDAAAQVVSQSGTLTFDNVDLGDTIEVTYSINGAPIWSGDTLTAAQATALAEGFSTGATGDTTPGTIPWTYDATLDLDFLGAGETITFSYRIVADDFGGSLASDIVTFTITGTNDAPVLVADENGNDLVTEAGIRNPGDPSATGKLLINDSDADAQDTLPCLRWMGRRPTSARRLPAHTAACWSMRRATGRTRWTTPIRRRWPRARS